MLSFVTGNEYRTEVKTDPNYEPSWRFSTMYTPLQTVW